MSVIPVVAIDGPAAAGKTVVGTAVARHFGWSFFDTGVLYRALTWKAITTGAQLDHGALLANLASQTSIDVVTSAQPEARPYDVWVDGRDVSVAIRSTEVDRAVSQVAAHAEVRTALISAQRALRRPPGIVVAGRDIGTVIFPDALVKIYLDASPQVRARRRSLERGDSTPEAEKVELRDVQRRDEVDQGRDAAPLRPAEDAVLLNTDDLDVQDVVHRVIELTDCALAAQSIAKPVDRS